jgi:hypothetical protein
VLLPISESMADVDYWPFDFILLKSKPITVLDDRWQSCLGLITSAVGSQFEAGHSELNWRMSPNSGNPKAHRKALPGAGADEYDSLMIAAVCKALHVWLFRKTHCI